MAEAQSLEEQGYDFWAWSPDVELIHTHASSANPRFDRVSALLPNKIPATVQHTTFAKTLPKFESHRNSAEFEIKIGVLTRKSPAAKTVRRGSNEVISGPSRCNASFLLICSPMSRDYSSSDGRKRRTRSWLLSTAYHDRNTPDRYERIMHHRSLQVCWLQCCVHVSNLFSLSVVLMASVWQECVCPCNMSMLL